MPWKLLPAIDGAVETEFVRRLHLGATILPFRRLEPWLTVIPRKGTGLLSGDDPRPDLYPGLTEWWRNVEAVREAHKGANSSSLIEQIDFRRKLSM